MNSDKQFEQNQNLIKNLESMHRQERIDTDPDFRNNLRKQLLGNFSAHQSATSVVHDIPVQESTENQTFASHSRNKLSMFFKLVPALLLLFVVVFSAKNLLFDTVEAPTLPEEDQTIEIASNPEKNETAEAVDSANFADSTESTDSIEAAGIATNDVGSDSPVEIAMKVEKLDPIESLPNDPTLPSSLDSSNDNIAAQVRVEVLADSGDLELDAPVIPTVFKSTTKQLKEQINQEILKEFIVSDLPLYSMEVAPVDQNLVSVFIELRNGDQMIYTYEKTSKGWKTISFEKTN